MTSLQEKLTLLEGKTVRLYLSKYGIVEGTLIQNGFEWCVDGPHCHFSFFDRDVIVINDRNPGPPNIHLK